MASNEKLIRIILKLKDEASAGLNKVGGNIDKMAGKMKSMGKTMSVGVTLPLLAVGVAGVKMASDLDKSMRNIQSISKQTDAEMLTLRDTFLAMSTDLSVTTDSADQLAQAFYNIQSSGFAGDDAMRVLRASTMAAAAGLTDTSTAAQGLTAVLNAYGKSASEAEHISDLMFRTVDRGVGTYAELTTSMSNIVGTAKAAGVGFDEVSAAMATMSKQGMSFSEASVSLNQTILAFIKPSEDMAKAIHNIGFESGLAMIQQLGFAGAMEALAKETGGSVEEMSKLFGNVRGLRGALSLTGSGAELFAADLAAMGDSAGAAAAAFAIQTQSFDAHMKNFKNVIGEFLITGGNILIPILSKIVEFITPVIKAFSDLPKPVQTAVVGLGLFLAAVGPLLIILSSLIGAFTTVVPIIMAVGGALVALNPAAIAIIASVGLLYLAFKNLGAIKEIVQSIVQAVGDFFRAIINKIKDFASRVRGEAQKMVKDIKSFFKIGSPSKLTTQMGRQVAQGFSAGFDKEQGQVAKRLATWRDYIKQVQTTGQAANRVSHLATQVGTVRTGRARAAASSAASSASGAFVNPFAGMRPGQALLQGGGGGNVNIGTLNVPPGTTNEQVDLIMRKIGQRVKRQGGSGLR